MPLPPELSFSDHARARMLQRDIAEADVEAVLRRPLGEALPGDGGNLVLDGYCRGIRLLRVIVTSDRMHVVTVMWRS